MPFHQIRFNTFAVLAFAIWVSLGWLGTGAFAFQQNEPESATSEPTEQQADQSNRESFPHTPIRLKYEPQTGEPHFDFALPSIDDQGPIRLSDLRGRKVLLIHFASW